MEKDKEERKRSHLRLVVDNVEKRPRPVANEGNTVSLEELAARRDELKPRFYAGVPDAQALIYRVLEDYLGSKGWPYGLDPQHGSIVVVPVSCITPEVAETAGSPHDEALLTVAEDGTEGGYCLTLETILPFYSEDEGVMEDALLYGPILPYGAIFLEENQQDGLLDLIYRVAFPLFPPEPSIPFIERFFSVAATELREIIRDSAVDA